MNLNFDLANVIATEFGIGRDDSNGQTFVAVPVDAGVQVALRDMVQATWGAMEADDEGPTKYQPSEKHAGTEYLYSRSTTNWRRPFGNCTTRRR
ncbi:MAG: hypothetical protein K0S45_2880 [Nitrospira sp.]|nr:hypothetical protein [Nitrospira sp.]